MSQFVDTKSRSFVASGALGQHLRVRSPNSLVLAGATDFSLGTLEEPTTYANEPVSVRLRHSMGTRAMVANGAITLGAPVFAAAAGKVGASGTIVEGVALEASTADNDIIEVLPVDMPEFGKVISTRQRFTVAQVNAGATVLAASPGFRYRMVDVALIAVGGAATAATSVDILATQSASSVKLLAASVTGLTQNTLLRAGATNAAILAAGASFVQNDVNTAITILKAGSDVATATHIDVLLTYQIEV